MTGRTVFGLAKPWRLASIAAARVTTPRTDIARSDLQVEEVVRGSFSGATVIRARAFAVAAWRESRLRRLVTPVHREWLRLDRVQSIRGIALLVIVAATVAAGLQLIEPAGVDRVVLLLPAVCGACGIAAWALAGVLARAAGEWKP